MTSSATSASTARSRRQVGTVASDDLVVSRRPRRAASSRRPRGSGSRRAPGSSRSRRGPGGPAVPSCRRLGPEQPVDAGRSEGDERRRRFGRVRVDRAGRDLATGPLGDEAGRAIRTEPGQPPFLALLEAQARVGAEGVAEGRPADADRVEDGRFDDDVGRPLPHLGGGAAHDPGDADRADRDRR